MESIKKHMDAAYQQLSALVVGGEGKMNVGLAMSHLVEAMREIMEKEKAAQAPDKGCGPGPVGPKGCYGGPCPACGAQASMEWDPCTDTSKCLKCGYTIGGGEGRCDSRA